VTTNYTSKQKGHYKLNWRNFFNKICIDISSLIRAPTEWIRTKEYENS
jgi:hypothetical protein